MISENIQRLIDRALFEPNTRYVVLSQGHEKSEQNRVWSCRYIQNAKTERVTIVQDLLQLENGSTIRFVCSADPNKLRGLSFDGVVISEEVKNFPEEVLERCIQ